MTKRILAFQMAKLGDFIQSTPLLAALKSFRPEARLVLAGRDESALAAARLSPLTDEVQVIGPGARAPAGEFEAVFVLNSDPATARLAGQVKAAEYYGPRAAGDALIFTPGQEFLMGLMAEDRRLGRFNLVDVWLSLLPGAGPGPLVWPAAAGPARRRPESRAGYKIGLHLGAACHLRRWPTENFVKFAAALAKLAGDFTPVLTGSAVERPLGARFEKLWAGPPPLNLQGATDLPALAGALAGLDLLATADTGVMHLAAAVGTPVLALFFGPAYGPETGPYGPGHVIYQAEAPCGPCREGICRRRQCLSLPEPGTAARLAVGLLRRRAAVPAEDMAEDTAEDTGEDPIFPPGHRAWRTGLDAFGQVLRPLGRPLLTAEEALALALTWAGRGVFRPGRGTGLDSLRRLAAFYAAPAAPPVLAAARWESLSARLAAFGEPQRRVLEILKILGVEIATSWEGAARP